MKQIRGCTHTEGVPELHEPPGSLEAHIQPSRNGRERRGGTNGPGACVHTVGHRMGPLGGGGGGVVRALGLDGAEELVERVVGRPQPVVLAAPRGQWWGGGGGSK